MQLGSQKAYSEIVNKYDIYLNIFIPFIYIIIVLFIDIGVPNATVTPLFALIGLMVFALQAIPGWMYFWSFIYSLIVLLIFFNPFFIKIFNKNASLDNVATCYIRSFTFFIGSYLASLLCLKISTIKSRDNDMMQFIQNMSNPLLISDINGRIIYCNHALYKLLNTDSEHIENSTFFDLFAPKNHQGMFIAEYLKQFDAVIPKHEFNLEFCGRKVTGTSQLVESRNSRKMVTILNEKFFY
jgi:PAS domain-containing protein